MRLYLYQKVVYNCKIYKKVIEILECFVYNGFIAVPDQTA